VYGLSEGLFKAVMSEGEAIMFHIAKLLMSLEVIRLSAELCRNREKIVS
jgi:hypothetical protein